MEGDNRAKRLKSSEDSNEEVAELRARRIAELELEIAQLRHGRPPEGVQQLERNHEVLPVVVKVVVTVDLSRVTTSIVAHITSFFGTPRELLKMALTCKSFGWRQPTSTLNWSLMEEVARQAVCSRATDDEMSLLPQYVRGTTTWLSILHRYERLLVFDVLFGGCRIEHRNGDRTTVRGIGDDEEISSAVSSGYVMSSGSHYAEFPITGKPCIGIVRPMPGLDARAYDNLDEGFSFIAVHRDLYPDFLSQRSNDWGDGNVHVCEYWSYNGHMNWTDWDDNRMHYQWDGMEGCEAAGDTVGMLLNLDEGTLTVYKNNRRLGVMKDGLSGPYCWYADVSDGDTVAIKRGAIPNN